MLTALVTVCFLEFVAIILLSSEIAKLHKVKSDSPQVTVRQITPAVAACQFCGNKLTKIKKSKAGWWCCDRCAILELGELPNQSRVNELINAVGAAK